MFLKSRNMSFHIKKSRYDLYIKSKIWTYFHFALNVTF